VKEMSSSEEKAERSRGREHRVQRPAHDQTRRRGGEERGQPTTNHGEGERREGRHRKDTEKLRQSISHCGQPGEEHPRGR